MISEMLLVDNVMGQSKLTFSYSIPGPTQGRGILNKVVVKAPDFSLMEHWVAESRKGSGSLEDVPWPGQRATATAEESTDRVRHMEMNVEGRFLN